MSALLAGAMLGQGVLNSYVSARNTTLTNRANRNLAEYQFDRNLEMWHLQNDYNSPQMQMERLKAAGLNPNLVYGSGAVANSSAQIPQYSAPRQQFNYEAPDLASTIQAYQNLRLQNAQIDNIKAQTTSTEAETTNKLITSGILGSEADIKAAAAQIAPFINQIQLVKETNQAESIQKDVILKETQNKLHQMELEWNKNGLSKNDQIQWRMLSKFLSEMGFTFDEITSKLKSPFKNWLELGKEDK